MKKIFGILISAVIFLGVLLSSGCGLIETDQTDDEEREEIMSIIENEVDLDAGRDYEGTLKILYQNIPSETAIIDAILDAFSEAYPNIEIERIPMVETNYLTLLPNMHSTAYRTGDFSEMPDVMWTTNEVFAGWIERDMLMPVNYFDEVDNQFSAEETFVELMLEDSMLGDKMYMFPRDYDQIVMYYNRELLSLAGIEESRIPSDRPLTGDEFYQLLVNIRNAFKNMEGTNAENERPYNQVRSLDAIWTWGSLCWPTLKSFGGTVMAEDGSVHFNTPENIAAATYVRELIRDELVFGTGSTKHANFVNLLTPLCFETRAVLTELIDQTQEVPGIDPEDLGVAPMPILDEEENYAIGAGCSGYAMYRYAENPTEAWLFLKFMASEAGQNAFCSTGNGVPSNKNLLFAENATWRNLTAPELSGLVNFNHDAFVYAWDTAACTLQDFKLLVDVVAAREPVAEEVSEVMAICLSTRNETYQTDIANAFARGEASIYSTIEGYRT